MPMARSRWETRTDIWVQVPVWSQEKVHLMGGPFVVSTGSMGGVGDGKSEDVRDNCEVVYAVGWSLMILRSLLSSVSI